MPLSSAVTAAGDQILATQHNALRTDINTASPVGLMIMWASSTAPTSFLMCEGGTIGDGSSGASVRANADTASLYAFLWNNFADAELAVSTGRGANAAADFAAHKTIALPNLQQRVPVGYDGSTFNAHGKKGGAETHTLTTPEMPSHTHNSLNQTNTGGTAPYLGVPNFAGTSRTLATDAAGGGGAHNNLQPYFVVRYAIRY